jgi:succinate dehydrogenase / fumarate reductase cytochrome b subunit
MRSTRVTDTASVQEDRHGAQLARRLLSLTGVFPLGAFLVLHLVVNARALRGEAAFTRAAEGLERFPAIALVEAVVVFVPLVVHAAVGLWLVVARQPLAVPSPYPRGVAIGMRATGLVALLSADLSSTWHGVPWRGALYLVGVAAVTFHFAAGLWGAFARSRHAELAQTRRVAAWAAVALGAIMWLLFTDVVVLHATGSRLFGSPAPDPPSSEPCPTPSG